MKLILIISAILTGSVLFAQDARKELRTGNDKYETGEFDKAVQHYQESLALDPNYDKAQFNLGDALYRNSSFTEAADQFEISAQQENERGKKAAAYHNLGNAFLSNFLSAKQEMEANAQNGNQPDLQAMQNAIANLQRSAESYKNALRNNSVDDETRHNLAYAKKLLEQLEKEQKENEQNQDQENKEDEEKKEDQQNQDQNEEQENKENQEQQNQDDKGEEKEEQNKPDENKDGEQEQQSRPQENKLSKEDAAKMLEALQKNEKDIHQKLKLKKQEGKRIIIEKDW